jgi:hypothetical protein
MGSGPVYAQSPTPAKPPTPTAGTDAPAGLSFPTLLPWPGLPTFFPSEPEIDLTNLPLFPDLDTSKRVEAEFDSRVAELNSQIAGKQALLYNLLVNWASDVSEIRQIQVELSELRTERDRLALEHLLLLRQLEETFVIPVPFPSTASSKTAPTPTPK